VSGACVAREIRVEHESLTLSVIAFWVSTGPLTTTSRSPMVNRTDIVSAVAGGRGMAASRS